MKRRSDTSRRTKWTSALGAVVLLTFPLAGVAHAQPTQQQLIQQGITAFQAERFQESLEVFQRAHKEQATNALVNFYLGVNLQQLERGTESIPFLVEALARDSSLTQTHYHLGVAYYQAREFDKALAAFRSAAKAYPDQAVLYYYEALVLLELGRPQEALAPLAKSEELDEAYKTQASFLRGVAYYQMGKAKEAAAAFKKVQELAPDSSLAGDAAKNLQSLEAAVKPPKRFTFSLSGGFQYDDNVIVEPNGFTILPGGFALGPQVNRRNDDGRGTASFRGEYRHPVADGVDIGFSYSSYGAFHGNLPHFNLNSHNPGAYLGIQLAPFYFRLEYDYMFSFLGNQSSVSIHSGGPNVFITLHPKLVSQVQFRFQDKVFFESRTRDSDAYVVTGTQYFYILPKGGHVKLGYEWEEEEVRAPQFDSDAGSLFGGFYLPLPWGLALSADAKLENREYDSDYFGLGIRDEDLVTVSGNLSKALWDGWSLSLSLTSTNNNSNVPDFDYDQNIFGINMSYSY